MTIGIQVEADHDDQNVIITFQAPAGTLWNDVGFSRPGDHEFGELDALGQMLLARITERQDVQAVELLREDVATSPQPVAEGVEVDHFIVLTPCEDGDPNTMQRKVRELVVSIYADILKGYTFNTCISESFHEVSLQRAGANAGREAVNCMAVNSDPIHDRRDRRYAW